MEAELTAELLEAYLDPTYTHPRLPRGKLFPVSQLWIPREGLDLFRFNLDLMHCNADIHLFHPANPLHYLKLRETL